jgi:hypothetical protein
VVFSGSHNLFFIHSSCFGEYKCKSVSNFFKFSGKSGIFSTLKILFTFLGIIHIHFDIVLSATQFKATSAVTNPTFCNFSVAVTTFHIFQSLSATFTPAPIAQIIAITFQAIFHISSACCSCGSLLILSISFQRASYTLFHIQVIHSLCMNS